MVKDYSEKLISMYLKDFTPEEVCAELKLCDTSLSSKGVKNKDSCIFCEYVLRFLDSFISEPKHEVRSSAF